MRPRRLSDVARAVGGRAVGPDVEVSRVVVHSAEAGPGALFVALAGERDDGHAHVGEALARGAAVLVRGDRAATVPGPAVLVADPGRALLDLAGEERRALAAPV
ncbi:MAG TPA: Mur ligase domain-containing protein, partial [Actinomycetota bacterium]|nr:Mur ligase domain-containing protein [Actinomycetota bacterium]